MKAPILLVLMTSAGMASAATIMAIGYAAGVAGNNNDEVDQWRSTDVSKTYDPDGDNCYGTIGYVAYATDTIPNGNGGQWYNPADPMYASNGTIQTLRSVPTFLTVTSVMASPLWAASYGYPAIDDPSAPIGPAVADVECGLAAAMNGGWNVLRNMVSLTIKPGYDGKTFRLGVMADGSDLASTIRLDQTVGGTATATINGTSVEGVPDMYFFDVVGAQAGDVFTLLVAKPYVGNPHPDFNALSFDVVPEAGTLSLLGLALAVAGRRRRR